MRQVHPPGATQWYVWALNSGESALNSQWWDHLDASFDKTEPEPYWNTVTTL